MLGIVGLHGAGDAGFRFAGVFHGILSRHRVRLICPASPEVSWADAQAPAVLAACERLRGEGLAVFVVGLSAGAVFAWSIRQDLEDVARGIVCVAGAPWTRTSRPSRLPALWLHGSDDRLFPADRLAQYAREVADDRVETKLVKGMGHSFPYRALTAHAWPWMKARA